MRIPAEGLLSNTEQKNQSWKSPSRSKPEGGLQVPISFCCRCAPSWWYVNQRILSADRTRASILSQALVNLAAPINPNAPAEKSNSDALSLTLPHPEGFYQINSSGLLVLVDPLLCFLRGVTIGVILSRQCVTELILMRGEIVWFTHLPGDCVLRNPATVLLALEWFTTDEIVFVQKSIIHGNPRWRRSQSLPPRLKKDF